ncbi:CinA family protein [Agromyces bauzanensis]
MATTGVAGPTEQDGKPAGTVYLGVALGGDVESIALDLHGDRAEIRAATVRAAIGALLERL